MPALFAARILAAAVGLGLCLSWAQADPARTPTGYSWPLAGLSGPGQLKARLMSGGCWLAGLPGYPRYNGRNVHAGVDIRATLGEPFYAIASGVVDAASDVAHSGYGPGWTQGYAMLVRSVLQDGTPCIVIYGHTQNHRVRGGERVVAGQMLAEAGPWLAEEGGPHLHLTVRQGELPRFGWGTPTLTGMPQRDGAECASCEAEVRALGYLNPLELLLGEDPYARRPSPQSVPDVKDFLRRAAAYWEASAGRPIPQPLSSAANGVAQPYRLCGAWSQLYEGARGEIGALVGSDGRQSIYWLREPVWSEYLKRGGPAKLGHPTGSTYDWPAEWAQSFDKALLVVEKSTSRVRVIWRENG